MTKLCLWMQKTFGGKNTGIPALHGWIRHHKSTSKSCHRCDDGDHLEAEIRAGGEEKYSKTDPNEVDQKNKGSYLNEDGDVPVGHFCYLKREKKEKKSLFYEIGGERVRVQNVRPSSCEWKTAGDCACKKCMKEPGIGKLVGPGYWWIYWLIKMRHPFHSLNFHKEFLSKTKFPASEQRVFSVFFCNDA